MLFINNLLSFALVMVCWWLAHLFSLRSKILGRVIALMFALVAMLVAVIAIFRNLDMGIDTMTLVTKGVYVTLFLAIGIWINGSKCNSPKSTP